MDLVERNDNDEGTKKRTAERTKRARTGETCDTGAVQYNISWSLTTDAIKSERQIWRGTHRKRPAVFLSFFATIIAVIKTLSHLLSVNKTGENSCSFKKQFCCRSFASFVCSNGFIENIKLSSFEEERKSATLSPTTTHRHVLFPFFLLLFQPFCALRI